MFFTHRSLPFAALLVLGRVLFALAPASAGRVRCAGERDTWRSTQGWSQLVRLAQTLNGPAIAQQVSGNIRCDRGSFGGDPAPDRRKRCWIWNYDWKRCATELGLCDFPGARRTQVRFGTTPHEGGRWTEKTVSGSIRCDWPSFDGRDPVPFKRKSCWYWDTPDLDR
jgi:hypothetical protein